MAGWDPVFNPSLFTKALGKMAGYGGTVGDTTAQVSSWSPQGYQRSYTAKGGKGSKIGGPGLSLRESPMDSITRALHGTDQSLKGSDLRTHAQGYLKGLTDSGISQDEAQKYLYEYLQTRQGQGLETAGGKKTVQVSAPAPGRGSTGVTTGGTQTVPTQDKTVSKVFGGTPEGKDAAYQSSPKASVDYIQQNIVPQAQSQLTQDLQLADQYAQYQAKQIKTNPITPYGLGRMGLPKGVPITPDNIKYQAALHYLDNTGQWVGDQLGFGTQPPRAPQPYDSSTLWSQMLTQRNREQAVVNAYGKLGTGGGAFFTGQGVGPQALGFVNAIRNAPIAPAATAGTLGTDQASLDLLNQLGQQNPNY